MAWATLPWLRYFSAFSSALLLLKAMDDFRLPDPTTPGQSFRPQMWLSGEVGTLQKPRSMRRRSHSAEGDNRGAWPRNPARRADTDGGSFHERGEPLGDLELRGRPRPTPLHFHFADLNNGLDVCVVGDIRHDLWRVGAERCLEPVHGIEQQMAHC